MKTENVPDTPCSRSDALKGPVWLTICTRSSIFFHNVIHIVFKEKVVGVKLIENSKSKYGSIP